jgi:hypothetical protein
MTHLDPDDDALADVFPNTLYAPLPRIHVFMVDRDFSGDDINEITLSPARSLEDHRLRHRIEKRKHDQHRTPPG